MKSLFSAGAAAVAALVLAGCSYVNPITTQQNYAPSDGTQLVAEEFTAFNLIVVSEGVGQPATLVGSLHNELDEDVQLEISFDAETATPVTVPARSVVNLTPLDGLEVTGTTPALAGLFADVGIAAGTSGFYTVRVPILDGTLPEYQAVIDAIG